jgi:hypothetical protein
MIDAHHAHGHKLRFYIIMVTLVVGGIFLLLAINDDGKGIDLSSAMISVQQLGNNSETEEVVLEETIFEERVLEEQRTETTNREVNFQLSFNQIPDIEKTIDATSIKVITDSNAQVEVNGDALELNNQDEVELTIYNVKSAVLSLDRKSISLEGKVRKIEVNGISLSSKTDLDIKFKNLVYQNLNFEDIKLNYFHLSSGDGKLNVEERLLYTIKDENLRFSYFQGNMEINNENSQSIDLKGIAKGVESSGSDLNLLLS